MNRMRIGAAIGAIVLALGVNLTPLSGGSKLVQLQTARADSTSQTVDASGAWNQVCAQWEFPDASFNGTFAEAWASVPNHHKTFDAALSGIRSNVNYLMNITSPPLGGDDVLSIDVHNWEIN